MNAVRWIATVGWILILLGCSAGKQENVKDDHLRREAPVPAGPEKIVLVEKPVLFQERTEPVTKKLELEFDLPRPPQRARLVMRYSGVPAALSEDYTMGRFRHKIELNNSFLMDLNTYSKGEGEVVEYTKWISVGMFQRHNKITFLAGDDGNRESAPKIDEYELRHAVLEFDW
jgi:hypothetical protein